MTEALRRPALLPALARAQRPEPAAPPAARAAGAPGPARVGAAAAGAPLLERARGDVVRACQEDPVFSPHADAARHVSGTRHVPRRYHLPARQGLASPHARRCPLPV